MVMRNRILAITRGSIPYVPELRPIAGSVTATILMQQLDYWFERYPGGFYKFQDASPDNPAYKHGDSWVEELRFSVAELRNAFDLIGHRHKSKTDWAACEEPFQGKFYCCYTDRRTRLTYYFRNHERVDEALDTLITVCGQAVPPSPTSPMPPIHAKSAAQRADFPGKTAGFTGSAVAAFPVNAQTQFPVNAQTQFPVTAETTDTRNAVSAFSHVDKQHSPEMQKVHSAYTENTGLQETTQKLQQPLPQGSTRPEDATETRSGSRVENIKTLVETLVFPKAAPVELQILAELAAGCRPENRQALLDEVEGARQQATLRSGIVPFARALAKAEGGNAFVSSLGVAVKAARERQRAHAASQNVPDASREANALQSPHQWSEQELSLLPTNMREHLLAKLQQGAAGQGAGTTING